MSLWNKFKRWVKKTVSKARKSSQAARDTRSKVRRGAATKSRAYTPRKTTSRSGSSGGSSRGSSGWNYQNPRYRAALRDSRRGRDSKAYQAYKVKEQEAAQKKKEEKKNKQMSWQDWVKKHTQPQPAPKPTPAATTAATLSKVNSDPRAAYENFLKNKSAIDKNLENKHAAQKKAAAVSAENLANKAPFTTHLLQHINPLSVETQKKLDEKEYGHPLNTQKGDSTIRAKVGDIVGEGVKFYEFGGALEAPIAAGMKTVGKKVFPKLTRRIVTKSANTAAKGAARKVVKGKISDKTKQKIKQEIKEKGVSATAAKVRGKSAAGSVRKGVTVKDVANFSVNRAADFVASTPMNIVSSVKKDKEGKIDPKASGKEFLKNSALDFAIGGGLDTAGSVIKGISKQHLAKLTGQTIYKMKTGQKLTESEKKIAKEVKAASAPKAKKPEEAPKIKTYSAPKTKTPAKTASSAVTSSTSKEDAKKLVKSYVQYKKDGNKEAFRNVVRDMEQKNKGTHASRPAENVNIQNKPATSEKPAAVNTQTVKQTASKAKTTSLKAENVKPEQKETYHKFVNSVDDNIVDYASRVKAGTAKEQHYSFGGIQQKEAAKIQEATGKNVTGYTYKIGKADIANIEKHHGAGGTADSTMSDVNDLGRIKYVMENSDEIKRTVDSKGKPLSGYTGKNGESAPMITYKKQIGENEIVVQAVADTANKDIRVVTAYMNTPKAKIKEEPAKIKTTKDGLPVDKDGVAIDKKASERAILAEIKELESVPKDSVPKEQPKGKAKESGTSAEGAPAGAKKSPDESQPAKTQRRRAEESKKRMDEDQSKTGKSIKKAYDKFVLNAVDSLHGMETLAKKIGGDAGDKLYHQTDNLRRAGEEARYSLTVKQTDFSHKEIGKGASEILSPIMEQGNATYKEFNDFLFHKLNIDRHKNNKTLWGKSGVTAEESQKIVDELRTKHTDFDAAAEDVVKYFRNLNTVRVESGLISKEQKDYLEELYENYVPAFRKANNKIVKEADQIIDVDRGIKTAKGGKQDILPIHEQMAYSTNQCWKAAELNTTIKDIAEAQGLDGVKIAKDYDIDQVLEASVFLKEDAGGYWAHYWENGKQKSVKIDEQIYRGMKDWTQEERYWLFNNVLSRGTGKFSNFFKSVITTYNPFFTVRNGLKDMGDALWYANSSRDFIAHLPKALKEMGKKGDYWKLWRAAGGKYSGNVSLEKLLKPTSDMRKAWSKMNPAKWIEAVNDAVEQYPRFTEFCSVLDKELKGADVSKATKEMVDKATHAGIDITCNFGRSGVIGRQANGTFVPFLNASIQGADKLARVLTGQKGAKGYLKLLTKLAVLGFAPSVAMEIAHANDPNYQDFNDRDKDNYFLFRCGDGSYFAFPKARSLATLSTPVQQAARKLLGTGDFDLWEFKDRLMNNVAPVSAFDANIFSPLINTLTNHTWYGGEIENKGEQKESKILRFNAQTSEISKKISTEIYNLIKDRFGVKWAEELTPSPKKIDHLIDSYTGIIGDVFLPATAKGRTKGVLKNVFDKNFKKDPVYSNKLATDYYDKQKEFEDKANSPGATAQDKAMARYFIGQNTTMKALNETKEAILMDDNLSREEKGRLDRKLQILKNDLFRESKQNLEYYDKYTKQHSKDFATTDSLIKAADRKIEQKTHRSVRVLDAVAETRGVEAAIKSTCYYTDKDTGKKEIYTDTKNNSQLDYYRKYLKEGGSKSGFLRGYRELYRINKEYGANLDVAKTTAVSVTITGKKLHPRFYKVYGVQKEDIQRSKNYFQRGGSMAEYGKATELVTNSCTSGKKGSYWWTPFKARGLASGKFTDRVYEVIDTAKQTPTIYKMNTARGLEHYGISSKYLAGLNDKCKKTSEGYNTKESVTAIVSKLKCSKEEKALCWDFLYGLSYKEKNPFGSIGDYSMKGDLGLAPNKWVNYGHHRGYWRNYGHRRYYRHGWGHGRGRGRGRGGGGSSGGSNISWESWLKKTDTGGVDEVSVPKKKTAASVKVASAPKVASYQGKKIKTHMNYKKLKQQSSSKLSSQQKALLRIMMKNDL